MKRFLKPALNQQGKPFTPSISSQASHGIAKSAFIACAAITLSACAQSEQKAFFGKLNTLKTNIENVLTPGADTQGASGSTEQTKSQQTAGYSPSETSGRMGAGTHDGSSQGTSAQDGSSQGSSAQDGSSKGGSSQGGVSQTASSGETSSASNSELSQQNELSRTEAEQMTSYQDASAEQSTSEQGASERSEAQSQHNENMGRGTDQSSTETASVNDGANQRSPQDNHAAPQSGQDNQGTGSPDQAEARPHNSDPGGEARNSAPDNTSSNGPSGASSPQAGPYVHRPSGPIEFINPDDAKSQQVASAMPNTPAPAPKKPEKRKPAGNTSGSGFFVSYEGHIITNFHVVDGCSHLKVNDVDGTSYTADYLGRHPSQDLALIKSEAYPDTVVNFRKRDTIRPGNDVVVLGYPLAGKLSSDVKVTTGSVSALSGPDDNDNLMQLSAPMQPGNSGGPVFDRSGVVVGISTMTMSTLAMARKTQALPQSLNFAVKARNAQSLMIQHGVQPTFVNLSGELDTADVAELGSYASVQIICK